jgi:putative transcriptional regulator
MSENATGKIVRYRRDNLPPDDTDWARVMATTDEEITAAAKADHDAQPLTPQQLARMRRASDITKPRPKQGSRSSPSSSQGLGESGRPYDAGTAKSRKKK